MLGVRLLMPNAARYAGMAQRDQVCFAIGYHR